ncbi:1-acyl-sn-glycerol-3-phosphate acyltransferase [Mycoplasmatota bacterium]|nr:1-acyl-sn-glycerol-3-phosphate acyltransferase [Mycoplasmatota bacterium]
MFRILWVYLNAFFYVLFHLIPIRKRYKNPEKYSIEERFKYIGRLCNIIVKRAGSKVIVEGRENVPDGAVLYTSNHPSMIDPYFVSYAVVKQLGAVIAGDLWFEKIPVLAPWFKSFGCIFVDRKNPREGIKAINRGIDNMKKGHSFILFPEGEITKMVTDEPVAKFQTGGLRLATKAKVPIVPVVVIGTDKIYTAHEVIGKLKKGTIVIKILKPYVKHISEGVGVKEIAEDLQQMTKETIESTIIPE